MFNLQQFVYPDELAKVRVVILEGEPWFFAADVCGILGIQNPADAIKSLDDDEKSTIDISYGAGNQARNIINEPGLYRFIIRSTKPEAKVFQRWITHEVLPAIRKTGRYEVAKSPDEIILLGYQAALGKIKQLENKVADDAPKVEFFDQVADCEGLHSMNEAAKILGWGPLNLFAHLRKMRILMENPHNMPRQKFIDCGYFRVRESTYRTGGAEHVHSKPMVTPKGLQWLQRTAPAPRLHSGGFANVNNANV